MQIFMLIGKKKKKVYAFNKQTINFCDKWVPVTTASHVLGLRMEERPPDMLGNCEYIE